jgi:AcrR family transcriptional regulator
MATEPSASARPYAGVSAEERRERRRAQFIAAGLHLFGTKGYAATTIREICRRARLTERYFYESFPDREALLVAAYEHVVAQAGAEVAAALARAPADPEARARAGLGAFVESLAADGRRARVVLLEVVGISTALEHRRRETMHAFADVIAANAAELVPEAERSATDTVLTTRALVGATHELLLDWTLGHLDVSPERLIDHCVRLYLTTIGVSSERAR